MLKDGWYGFFVEKAFLKLKSVHWFIFEETHLTVGISPRKTKSYNVEMKKERMMEKKCYRCGQIKDFSEFYNDSTRKDGKQSNCKECRKKYKQDHKYSEYHKRYRQEHRLKCIWHEMIRRCTNPKSKDYKNYGGRGIYVIPKFMLNYENFEEWSLANGYYEQPKDTPRKDKLSLDRINNNEGYMPQNCRWIPFGENVKRQFIKAS